MFTNYLKRIKNIRSVDDFFKLILELLSIEKIRFLVVGFYNTVISYLFGLFYFKYLEINFFKIILFNIAITIHSFISHKFLSFKKSYFSLKEIRRGVIVYGSMYIFSATLIMTLISFGFSQLVAYHINIILSIIIFYFLHSFYTFK
jgi:hypothetical protein